MDFLPQRQPVSEGRRERETFRYDPALIAQAVRNDVNRLITPSQLRSSPDPVLTALAELGVLRLKATRALISLFDRNFQYIVAEATPSLPLTPNAKVDHVGAGEHLLLCGTAIPRSAGICELSLGIPLSAPPKILPGRDVAPVTIIPDILLDSRSSQRSFCQVVPQSRFYAGVPIRTQKGIDIGVFCVFDEEPRQGLDDVSLEFIRQISNTIMEYLDSKRRKDSHRRADRMVRGVGSFVEGKTTMSGQTMTDNPESFVDDISREGALNQVQQNLQQESEVQDAQEEVAASPQFAQPRSSNFTVKSIPSYRPGPSPILMPNVPQMPTKSLRSVPDFSRTHPHDPNIGHIFSKAANIIREAIEIESVLFLDATILSFGGLAVSAPRHAKTSGIDKPVSSSSDESECSSRYPSATPEHQDDDQSCRILGFSSSSVSSINGGSPSQAFSKVSDKFLNKLLQRYPEGKIFNFEENGEVQSTDVSGDEVVVSSFPSVKDDMPTEASKSEQGPEPCRKRPLNKTSRQNEGKMIASIFPGSRSVAIIPLWDVNKHRWYAGAFVCTMDPTRTFSVEDELSYLRAFGTVVMAEVDRSNSLLVEQSKTDLLNSLSHELRSPLHGIILGAELLYDTSLDGFQGETLVSIENCGRTLLETIDHLLDWSKINNFRGLSPKKHDGASRIPESGIRSHSGRKGRRGSGRHVGIEAGMMSITFDVEVDVLAEEVVESVCAGFSYQRLSIAHLIDDGSRNRTGTIDAIDAIRRLDSMQAIENSALGTTKDGNLCMFLGDVPVTFDISPALSWTFHTQPGAIRRIIMNLLGNSLKFTSKGFINVSVLRIPPVTTDHGEPSTQTGVKIIITDTGRGISEDFLHNQLFVPFSQEDRLSVGTGLGLSLVHQIVGNLGGSIQVWSKVDIGTKVTVILPLQEASPPSPTGDPGSAGFDEFASLVSELKGLRVRLHGLPTESEAQKAANPDHLKRPLSEGTLIANTCLDWLQMEVLDDSTDDTVLADLVLSTEASVDELLCKQRHAGVSMPVVIICRNSLIARQLATSPRFSNRGACFDFISQPVGPRKLAKVLLMSFRRWINSQASAIPTPSQLSLTTAETSPIDQHGISSLLSLAEHLPNRGEGIDGLSDLQTNEKATIARPQQATRASGEGMVNERVSEYLPTKHERLLPERPRRDSRPFLPPKTVPMPKQLKKSHANGPKLLLVDDNPINVNILASYAKKLGYRYETATNGKEALDKFEVVIGQSADRFQIILMDISMPVMDGFESSRRIRAVERENHLPRCNILALTGLASASAQQEAFASGIDLFLTKPVRLKELSKIIEEKVT